MREFVDRKPVIETKRQRRDKKEHRAEKQFEDRLMHKRAPSHQARDEWRKLRGRFSIGALNEDDDDELFED